MAIYLYSCCQFCRKCQDKKQKRRGYKMKIELDVPAIDCKMYYE